MAFANKYLFRFDSVAGVEYNIYILADGYEGDVIQRPLGKAPILHKKQNGPIHGTSLEFYAECQVDGELAELYTSSAKAFRVDLYRNGTLIWVGFVQPELYSEPEIAPPYDVQIIAADGLGELKEYKFTAGRGTIALGTLFRLCLGASGRNASVIYASALTGKWNDGTRDILQWYINMDFMDGKSYYDVLTMLLESLHATVTAHMGSWLIARETDILHLPFTERNGLTVKIDNGAQVITTTLPTASALFGQMGSFDWWPVGYLTSIMQPAKKSIKLTAPWHLINALKDKTMEANNGTWNIWGSETYFNTAGGRGYWIGNGVLGSARGYIQQRVPMNFMATGLTITVHAMASNTTGTNTNGALRVYAQYHKANSDMYGSKEGWFSNTDHLTEEDLGKVEIGGSDGQTRTFTIEIPKLEDSDYGDLYIIIGGANAFVSYADIELQANGGYQDVILLNNGARGAADDVEIVGGRVLSEGLPNYDYFAGFWRKSAVGSPISGFWAPAVTDVELLNFMSTMALDMAYSCALVRRRVEGKLNVPASAVCIPLFLARQIGASVKYWIETYDWDLREDEVRISALSLPVGTLSVESETVNPIKNN